MFDSYTDTYWEQHNHRHHHCIDTEPAFVVRPGESCCTGKEEQCECVTSADIEAWNKISAISAISGIENLSALSAFNEIKTSADLWNSTSETVSSNSANWDSTNEVSSISSELIELSATIEKLNNKLYFGDSISGDGTENSPYGVEYGQKYKDLIEDLTTSVNKLFNSKGVPNFIKLDAKTKQYGINPYIQSLFNQNDKDINDIQSTIEYHAKLLDELIKNAGSGSGKINNWKFIKNTEDLRVDEIPHYSASDTIYYTYSKKSFK